MSVTISGTDGVSKVAATATIDASAVTSGTLPVDRVPYVGRRNLIINGAMQVAQRGTNRSFGQKYNALDRWATGQYQYAGHEQVSVTDTNVPVKKAIRVTSSSATEASSGTRMALAQMVESQNCDFLAGKQVTLSFWIRFSANTVAGTYSGFAIQLPEYDSVDPNLLTTSATRWNDTTIANGSYPTTWTKYTVTITCASTMKNLGARFLFHDIFSTANSSDVWYEVTGVQLEVGSVATPFEHRSYGEELALCQRYLEYFYGAWLSHATGGAQYTGGVIKFTTTKRASPTISVVDAGLVTNIMIDGVIGMDATAMRVFLASAAAGTFEFYNRRYKVEAEL